MHVPHISLQVGYAPKLTAHMSACQPGSTQHDTQPLVTTEDTERKLELLATACQSGRTVLLEGDTCSQKTALVEELARITQCPLTVISLGSETGE